MANQTPPKYRPSAIATPIGWAHDKTGEQLVSVRGLEPAEGTEDYKPNSRKWIKEYQEATADTAPANTVAPSITGTAKVGSVLTGTAGTWTGRPTPVTALQWLRGGVDIAGATASTYTLVAADAGTTVSLKVTATNSVGSVSATSAATATVTAAPVNTAVPTISGTPKVGTALTATTGTWTGTPTPTYAYQWKVGGTNAGTNAATYTPVASDAGKTVTVTVTATNSAGTATANSTATAAVTQTPANTAVPVVSGTTALGDTLTTTNGTWTGTPAPTFTYQWTRGGTNIAGATAATYVITAADQGTTLVAKVTATNSAGTATANSAGTAVPAA